MFLYPTTTAVIRVGDRILITVRNDVISADHDLQTLLETKMVKIQPTTNPVLRQKQFL